MARLRCLAFNTIISQDIAFFDKQKTGELTNRLAADTQVLQNACMIKNRFYCENLCLDCFADLSDGECVYGVAKSHHGLWCARFALPELLEAHTHDAGCGADHCRRWCAFDDFRIMKFSDFAHSPGTVFARYLKSLTKQFQDFLAKSNSTAEEAIGGIRTVRSFACDDKVNDTYSRDVEESYEIGKKYSLVLGSFVGIV